LKSSVSKNSDEAKLVKVLHLIDSGGLYGAERMLLTLARKQRERGLDVMILSAGTPGGADKAIEQACAVQGLPCISWQMSAGLNLRAGGEIVAWAKKNRFTVLHSHGYKFNILIGLLSRKRRAFAFVSTIHGYTATNVLSRLFVYKVLDRLLSFRPDRVAVVNNGLRKVLLSKRNVRFIPNGIDINEEADKALPVDPQWGRYIVVVGRLSAEKAVWRAIAAFAVIAGQYPDYVLIIVGDGPKKSEVELTARNSSVSDRIIFTGYSDHAVAYIRRAEALLISSESEGLPLTLLEAMRVLTPVVSTPVGEIPNVLGHGTFGYLSSDLTDTSVAHALVQLLGDPAQASKKAQLAHDRLLDEYTSDEMNERYLALYQEALAR